MTLTSDGHELVDVGHGVGDAVDVGAAALRAPVTAVVERVDPEAFGHEPRRHVLVAAAVLTGAVCQHDHPTRLAIREPRPGEQPQAADPGQLALLVDRHAHSDACSRAGAACSRAGAACSLRPTASSASG